MILIFFVKIKDIKEIILKVQFLKLFINSKNLNIHEKYKFKYYSLKFSSMSLKNKLFDGSESITKKQ